MDSFNDVLDAAKAYCREHTADATYQYYISGLKAVSFENSNCITLEVRNDFICKIVSDRYTGLLKDAFKAVLGFDVEVKFTVPQPEPEAAKEKRPMDEASLPSGRYDFTFENFIRGPSNQFAFAAAQAVAANPSGAYNPLFIYGPSGLGKTHLLNAIQIEIHKNHPDYNIVYVDCEKFTNEIITAVKMATTEQFRQKYREADVLLIDDIQFLAGKESTQEEFFHTFNTLHNAGKQIVLASDRPAKESKSLEERLRTRFEWGLTADIQPPDFETRMAIIKNKSVSLGFDLPNDVCTFIAENVTSNVRLLEGTVKKIRAYHDLDNMELTVPNVSRAIKDMYNKEKAENLPTPHLIIGEVSRFYNIEESVIRGTLKNKNPAEARQVAMYLVRKLTNLSLPDIGKEFGRDHSTVIHSLKKVEQQLAAGTGTLADNIRDITANINSKLRFCPPPPVESTHILCGKL